MNLMFMHVGPDTSMAEMMVQSARSFGYYCAQLTDMDSPKVSGVQDVFRLDRGDEGIMFFRAKLYAAYNAPGVYVDTDMLIMRDIEPVMGLDFDLAVTKTKVVVKDPNGVNVTELMPYNGGCLYVKNKRVMPYLYECMAKMPQEEQRWYGDQIALNHAYKEFETIELPNKLYNYTPKPSDTLETTRDKYILHFKGARKERMPFFI